MQMVTEHHHENLTLTSLHRQTSNPFQLRGMSRRRLAWQHLVGMAAPMMEASPIDVKDIIFYHTKSLKLAVYTWKWMVTWLVQTKLASFKVNIHKWWWNTI